MRRTVALLLTLTFSHAVLAEDATPDIVLSEDEPAVEPAAEQPPIIEIDAGDQPDLAFADASDPNPGSGAAQIVAGWIASGIGLGGVAQVSACELDIENYDRGRPGKCRNVGIVLGVIGLGIGIPWLVFGYQKRRALRAWKARHGLSALPDLELAGSSLRLTF
jgi:hypothetical protein